jgi:hypothetical protein
VRYRRIPEWACETFSQHGEYVVCAACLAMFREQGSKTQYSDLPPLVTFGRGWFSIGAVHYFTASDDTVFPARDGSSVLAKAVCGGICDVTLPRAPRADGFECAKCLQVLRRVAKPGNA